MNFPVSKKNSFGYRTFGIANQNTEFWLSKAKRVQIPIFLSAGTPEYRFLGSKTCKIVFFAQKQPILGSKNLETVVGIAVIDRLRSLDNRRLLSNGI